MMYAALTPIDLDIVDRFACRDARKHYFNPTKHPYVNPFHPLHDPVSHQMYHYHFANDMMKYKRRDLKQSRKIKAAGGLN